jgi:hypothetical protein
VRIRHAHAPKFGCRDRWSVHLKTGAQKVPLRTFTQGGPVLLSKLGKCIDVIRSTVVAHVIFRLSKAFQFDVFLDA